MALEWKSHDYGSGATAKIGRIVTLTVVWSPVTGEDYRASVNNLRLKARFPDIPKAKAAAEKLAKQLIVEAYNEVSQT